MGNLLIEIGHGPSRSPRISAALSQSQQQLQRHVLGLFANTVQHSIEALRSHNQEKVGAANHGIYILGWSGRTQE